MKSVKYELYVQNGDLDDVMTTLTNWNHSNWTIVTDCDEIDGFWYRVTCIIPEKYSVEFVVLMESTHNYVLFVKM